jgi:hypothetical protein
MNHRGLHPSHVIGVNVVGFSQNVQLLSQGYEVFQAAQEAHVFVDIYVYYDAYEDKFSIVS